MTIRRATRDGDHPCERAARQQRTDTTSARCLARQIEEPHETGHRQGREEPQGLKGHVDRGESECQHEHDAEHPPRREPNTRRRRVSDSSKEVTAALGHAEAGDRDDEGRDADHLQGFFTVISAA
jgi:hypothetical protein